ncbi:hypothetical protein HGK82_00765 [Ochrobactrum sp. MT180101]|nr:hypothetical protein HGK82_00765 [Ochrobactrum sp. MT180101]
MYQLNVATEATYLYIPVTVADEIAAAQRDAAIERQVAFDDAWAELAGLIKTQPCIMCVEAVEFAVVDLLNASAAVGVDGVEIVLDVFRSEFNAGWQMTNNGVVKIDAKELTIQAGQTIRGFQHVDVAATTFGLPASDDTVGHVLRPLLVTVTTAEGEEMSWATDWLTYEDDLGVEIVRWMM